MGRVAAVLALLCGCDLTAGKDSGSEPTGSIATEDLPATTGLVTDLWEDDVANGSTIPLDWADDSVVACFPANLNAYYEGPHLFFLTEIPAASELVVTLAPEESADLSLYAYAVHARSEVEYPPAVTSVVACEASPDGAPFLGPGVVEEVSLYATTTGYDVVVGVAGVAGVTEGAFVLRAAVRQ